MGNRIVHFEIHASDPKRAMAFYEAVFGWAFPQWMEDPPYWGVMTAAEGGAEPGIDGGLVIRRGEPPREGAAVNAYVCTVQVEDFDEVRDRVLGAGGTVAVPKFPIPGVAWQGYFKDTEGNIFGVHQPDERAPNP